MREYELLMVLQPGLDDEGVGTVIEEVEQRLQKDGGAMVSAGQLSDRKGNVSEVTEGWKTRRLAYPIANHREGYYVVLRLQTPPTSIDEMERGLRLDENVLRYMTVREDEMTVPAVPAPAAAAPAAPAAPADE